MKIFALALLVFVLAFAALGIGLFFRRPAMRRTCAATGENCHCDAQAHAEKCDCEQSEVKG